MFGSQTLALKVVVSLLDAFLVVDRKDIEGKVLSTKGNLKLVNVELKQQKIPITSQCALLISGTLKEIDLQWNFSNTKTTTKSTCLVITGARICVSFHQESQYYYSPKKSPIQNGHFSFATHIMNELRDLQESVSKSIVESDYVKKPLQALLDSFSIKINDVEVDIEVPSLSDDEGEENVVQFEEPQKIVRFVAKSIAFVTEDNGFEIPDDKNDLSPTKRRPILVRLDLHSVGMNLLKGRESPPFPILEPMTYVLSVRRRSGSRFLDMTTGYQAIGRQTASETQSQENEDNCGVVLHLGLEQIEVLHLLVNQFMDEDSSDGDDDFDDLTPKKKYVVETHYLSSATPIVLVFIFAAALWQLFKIVLGTDPLSFVLQNEINIVPLALVIAVLAGLIVEVSMGVHMVEKFHSVNELNEIYGTVHKEEVHPATYRLPVPYITMIGPDSLRMTLTKTAVMGQVGVALMNFSADSCKLDSLNTDVLPRISASGIRAAVVNRNILLNVDETHEVFIPGQVHTIKPIRATVVRFQNGKVTVKVNNVDAEILRGMDEEEKQAFYKRMESSGLSDVHESKKLHQAINDGLRKGVQATAKMTVDGVQATAKMTVGVTGSVKKGVQKAAGGVKGTVVGGVKIMAKKTKQVRGSFDKGKGAKPGKVVQDSVEKGVERVADSLEKGKQKVAKMAEDANVFKQDGSNKSFSTIRMDGKSIQIRHVINNEIRQNLMKLKLLAMEFESISLQKNRYNLRLYPRTFRGCHAVDFLLETKHAKTRAEAVRIGRNLQTEFNLFDHVAHEFKFRDDYNCVYFFVDVKKRRNWEALSPRGDVVTQGLLYEWDETPFLPFPVEIDCKHFVLKFWQDQKVAVDIRDSLVLVKPGSSSSRVVDATVFLGQVQNHMVDILNVRIKGKIHPDLPGEVHGLQFSLDSLRASPGYTAQDWYDKLGFDSNTSAPSSGVVYVPYTYIAPFSLHLSWQGILVDSKETDIKIHDYSGTESTTSTDLIKFFVVKVLGRAPGIIANIRVMGVNISETAGLATTASVAAKFVPFGQYLGIAAFGVMDVFTGALDAGKEARDDPYGSYKPGDITRGIIYSAKLAARKGAKRRGRMELYDAEDEVTYDPVDFAVGASEGLGTYVYNNKARFAGGAVAAATMIGTVVIAGPIGCILIGIGAGAATEFAVNKAEEKVKKRTNSRKPENSFRDDDSHDGQE